MRSCIFLTENTPEGKLGLRFSCRKGCSRGPSRHNRLAPTDQQERKLRQLLPHEDRIERKPKASQGSQPTWGKGPIFKSLEAPQARNRCSDRFRNNQQEEETAQFSLYQVNEQELIIN